MKFIDEYRDAEGAKKLSRLIHQITTQPWTIMEVCGGQTHSIVKYGIDTLLPDKITLVHGPGCPVCVTPLELIDKAIMIAARPEVILCSFGDMLRVPGSEKDLFSVKAEGGDVRIVYSPLDALKLAEQNPEREVVFFAVGFETTAPATAMAVYQAYQKGITNFSLLVSHVLVPPVMGYEEYIPIARKYKVPIVVTGFEPLDILQGVYMCVKQLEEGRAEVENQYLRTVRKEGNRPAQELIKEVFQVSHRKWRGVGEIPRSGLQLREKYLAYDAERKFNMTTYSAEESGECIAGLVLQGVKKPFECALFGKECTPEHPQGAPMVSSEGACAAYYRYRGVQV